MHVQRSSKNSIEGKQVLAVGKHLSSVSPRGRLRGPAFAYAGGALQRWAWLLAPLLARLSGPRETRPKPLRRALCLGSLLVPLARWARVPVEPIPS